MKEEKHGSVTSAVEYICNTYAQEDEVLHSIRKKLEDNNIAIQIGAEEGRLLQVFIKMHKVKRIIEIGTLGGYSTIWMARALPEDGRLVTIESNERHAAWAQEVFDQSEVGGRISLKQGKALDVLNELVHEEKFDMIFIDADKAGYPGYLTWAEKHLKESGLIIADNTLMFSDICAYNDHAGNKSWEAIRDFNERIADQTKYDSTIVPTASGLTVAVKR